MMSKASVAINLCKEGDTDNLLAGLHDRAAVELLAIGRLHAAHARQLCKLVRDAVATLCREQ
jgi:hypothetical protein